MKKRIVIRIIAIALAVIMILGMLLAFDLNNVEAGESLSDCGANLSVSIGGDPVTLTIEVKNPSWNNGLMDNFSYGAGIDDFPWADYRDQIQIIEIKNGHIISDSAHPEVAAENADALHEEAPLNAPSGYYHAPTEDAEIESFLMNYGNDKHDDPSEDADA